MQILKSSRDAIGTAAGVAWPTFGIIFNTLGLAIGGLSAIILGSASLSLFLIVALPIAYWSYKNHFEEKRTLHLNIKTERKIVREILLSYLLNTLKQDLIRNNKTVLNSCHRKTLICQLKEKIFRDTHKIFKKTHQLEENLDALLKDFFTILIHKQIVPNGRSSKIKKLRNYIYRFIRNNERLLQFQSPSLRSQIKIGAMCFTASFGSIAGCMAGMLGLLIGLGVLTGLAAIPIVGWISLGVAFIFGLATASHSIKSFRNKYKQNQIISFYKKINNHFVNTNKFINTKFSTGKNRKFHNNHLQLSSKPVFYFRNKKIATNKNLYAASKGEAASCLASNLINKQKLKRN